MENTFASQVMNKATETVTENGAKTYSSTLNKNLDFFAMAGGMRQNPHKASTLFLNAYNENPDLAIRNLFYIRDVRGGQGERDVFLESFQRLIPNIELNTFKKIFKLIGEYGRYGDMFDILYVCHMRIKKLWYKKRFRRKVQMFMMAGISCIKEQLSMDLENYANKKNISLLAKWFPMPNNIRNDDRKEFAKFLVKVIFGRQQFARKKIGELREYLKVTERLLSSDRIDEINYEAVPSGAMLKYANTFQRKDTERYQEYLDKVNSGKAMIHTKTLYPYEIVRRVRNERNIADKIEAYDLLWKKLHDYTSGESAIVAVDVSSSMEFRGEGHVKPIDVSISLGIYFAERNKSAFKNILFTFAETPNAVMLEGNNIFEKVRNVYGVNWGLCTNIQAYFDMFLELAKNAKREDIPKSIIVISDMEFDYACDTMGGTKTNFELIRKKFKEANIECPRLIFWNVFSSGENVPVRSNEENVILVSGSSPMTFAYIMEGKNPMDFMLSVLNSPRYEVISTLIK